MAKRRLGGGLALALILALHVAQASPPTTAVIGTPPQPPWQALSGAQKNILAPLARDWDSMEHIRRKQWLAIAERYPKLDATEQERLQQRMRDWVKLTPEQRARARDSYRNLNQLPAEQKQLVKQKWSAYANLPPEEKQAVRENRKSSALLAPPPAPLSDEQQAEVPAPADAQ